MAHDIVGDRVDESQHIVLADGFGIDAADGGEHLIGGFDIADERAQAGVFGFGSRNFSSEATTGAALVSSGGCVF